MPIEIEKNVPMPFGYQTTKGVWSSLRSMAVGDSFKVPEEMSVSTLRSTVSNAEFRGKFSVRKTADGFRCWRTA